MDMDLIEDRFVAFCRKQEFQDFVRQAINNELFRKQMFDDFRIGAKIQAEVNNRVGNEVRTYLADVLSAKISAEMTKQLPQMFQNNYQLRNLVNDHQAQVDQILTSERERIASHNIQLQRMIKDQQQAMTTQNLELRKMIDDQNLQVTKAITGNDRKMAETIADQEGLIRDRIQARVKTVIEEIINDHGYHQVNQAYFTAFIEKGDHELETFRKSWVRELRGFQAEKDQELKELKGKVEGDLAVLKDRGNLAVNNINRDYRENLEEMRDNLADTQKHLQELKSLRDQVSNLKVMMGGLCAVVILGVSLVLATSFN